jgi:hypothetical protein
MLELGQIERFFAPVPSLRRSGSGFPARKPNANSRFFEAGFFEVR